MKKIMVLLVVLSLLTLCACKGDIHFEVTDTTDPVVSDSNVTEPTNTDPVENVTSDDWETPIDIDDSFQPEEDVTTSTNATEPEITVPSDETEPSEEPTSAPTEPVTTEPDPTEPATEPEVTSRPIGSGPIELPPIPG